MSDTTVLPAPELSWPASAEGKWEREYQAFLAQRGELLKSFRDQYVAVHQGQVVAHGPDKIEVALRAYRDHGHVPMYVGLVSDTPIPPARLRSPRTPSRNPEA